MTNIIMTLDETTTLRDFEELQEDLKKFIGEPKRSWMIKQVRIL
jgi:hypothetical protein